MNGACQDCHREIAWLRSERRGLHARETTVACASCHPDHAGEGFQLIAWTADSLARFDHRRAGWPLEGAHADQRCDACHKQAFRTGQAARLAPAGAKPTWWIGLETGCVSCHEDVHRGRLKSACTDCHSSEAWAPAPKFDHARTGYPLTGRHGEVACEKCHTARTGMVKAGMSRLVPPFAPLRFAECSACHADPHEGRLGATCGNCHLTTGFRDRKGPGFDHSRTRYPLDGKHAGVKCAGCHAGGATRRAPAFGTCAACHKDAHGKSATTAEKVRDCAACHTVAGFTRSSFDSTRHTAARCEECHLAVHASQLSAPEFNTGCVSCHQVETWTASTFGADRHRPFGLPLEGRHGAVGCGACHGGGRKELPAFPVTTGLGTAGVLFKLGTAACVSCHVTPHPEKDAGDCVRCHDARSFAPSTVDLAAHARLKFVLDGAHRAVACGACHEGMGHPTAGSALLGSPRPRVVVALAMTKTTCADCHQDPHGGEFRLRDGGRCDRCHDAEAFVPAARFDHDRDAAFRLVGGHQKVPCLRCHPPVSNGSGAAHPRYRPTPTACESCHPAKPPTPPVRGPR
jgi:hypothetical protein